MKAVIAFDQNIDVLFIHSNNAFREDINEMGVKQGLIRVSREYFSIPLVTQ